MEQTNLSIPPKNNNFLIILLSILLLISIIVAGFFAYQTQKLVAQLNTYINKPEPLATESPTPTPDPTADWETYTNTQYGYLVKYSPSLNSIKEISDDIYLSLVNFENPSSEKENFQVSVRKSTLNEELQYQKWTIEGHILVELDKENNINFQNYKGIKLEYKPIEDKKSINPFTIVIINNGKYSYTISSAPDQTDIILSTFKFLDAASPSPKSNIKTLNYQLPSGWQTVSDKDNIFSIGFNPSDYNASTLNSRIDLNSKLCCSSIFFKTLPYNGGSKHDFTYNNSTAVKVAATMEQEYLINGKSGMILYDVDASGSNTVGMIVLNSKQALLIESQTSSRSLIESILSTIKFTD
ncbi:MAG: hypothetical protein U0946_05240 [Patescibacteria group bacterium]|nr:hypothetical protein [Patescibacteria group bacterium]